jgi:hypothetical protein
MNYSVKTKTTSGNNNAFRNILFILSLVLCTTVMAQDVAGTEKGILKFESDVIDYGTIDQNSDGVRAFKFTNVGKAPIVITQVKGSCGCTVPTKPEGAIMPGESAEIGVRYATDRLGAFSKTVTVTSNASEAKKILKIKGKVLAVEN